MRSDVSEMTEKQADARECKWEDESKRVRTVRNEMKRTKTNVRQNVKCETHKHYTDIIWKGKEDASWIVTRCDMWVMWWLTGIEETENERDTS